MSSVVTLLWQYGYTTFIILMPGFRHSVGVLPLPLPFRRSVVYRCRSSVPLSIAIVAVARENGIDGNVFPLTPLTAFEQ